MPRPPAASWALAIGGLACLAGGCGGEGPPPAVCTEGPGSVLRALARAPAPVRFPDGTRLSACVRRARSEGDLQSVGVVITQVADRLQDLATGRAAARGGPGGRPAAALELGYLIGAVESGARTTNGVAAELARRVEQDGAGLAGGGTSVISALRQGRAAGQASG